MQILPNLKIFRRLENGKSYSFLDTLYIWELYYVSNYDENMNLMTWDPFRNLAFTIFFPTVWKHFNFFVKSNFSARRFKFHVKSISVSLESKNVLFWQLQHLWNLDLVSFLHFVGAEIDLDSKFLASKIDFT